MLCDIAKELEFEFDGEKEIKVLNNSTCIFITKKIKKEIKNGVHTYDLIKETLSNKDNIHYIRPNAKKELAEFTDQVLTRYLNNLLNLYYTRLQIDSYKEDIVDLYGLRFKNEQVDDMFNKTNIICEVSEDLKDIPTNDNEEGSLLYLPLNIKPIYVPDHYLPKVRRLLNIITIDNEISPDIYNMLNELGDEVGTVYVTFDANRQPFLIVKIDNETFRLTRY